MGSHYYETGAGSPLENYVDVDHTDHPSPARNRVQSNVSNGYYDVAGYNVVEDGGGYYDVALPESNPTRVRPSGRNCSELPAHETTRVFKVLPKELRQGLMNQLLNGIIHDDDHALVPDYGQRRHVSVRGAHIRKELTENYYEEIKDLVGVNHYLAREHENRSGPSLHRPSQANRAQQLSNMQPPNKSPRPPVRGDSAWGASSNPHGAAATPTTPTAASNHVPLPERRRPQRAVWYKRAWDWIHDHPKISVPLLIGALLTVVIVIVVVAVTVADHKESEVTTTRATPNIRQYGIS